MRMKVQANLSYEIADTLIAKMNAMSEDELTEFIESQRLVIKSALAEIKPLKFDEIEVSFEVVEGEEE